MSPIRKVAVRDRSSGGRFGKWYGPWPWSLRSLMVGANPTTTGDVGEAGVQSVETWENPGHRPPEIQASGGRILSAQDGMLDGVL